MDGGSNNFNKTVKLASDGFFIFLFVSLLFFFSPLAPVHASPVEISTLKVGASNNFPPVNMTDDNGELIGFGRDVATAVLRAEGIEAVYQHSGIWAEVEGWLKSGEIDLIHDTGFNAEREKYLDYTLPILEMPEVIFVRNEQYDIQSFDDLAGRKVACVNKHISHIYLKQYPDIECKIVQTPAEGIIALINGDVEAFVYPEQVSLYLFQKFDFIEDIKVAGKPIRILKWGMTVRKGRKELVASLNSGIRKIRASGEYAAIYDKWFGRKIFHGYTVEEVVWIVAISLLLTLMFVISLGLYVYSRRVKKHNNLLYQAVNERKHLQIFLDSVVNNLPAAVFVKDAKDLRYVRLNNAAEELFGISHENSIGKSDYDFWSKEEADFFTNYDREVLAGGVMVDIPEEPLHTHGQGLRLLHTKKIPIQDENGEPLYLLGMSEDISERKQVEKQLEQHREHLEELVEARTHELRMVSEQALQASKSKSAFLANMSHELRTPLNSIIGFSKILKTGAAGEVNEEQTRQLEMINTSANRLLSLISDILDLSRVEAGKTEVNITEFKLDELLTELKELLQPQFEGKEISLKLENMSTRDTIRTDKGKLHQILLNLLGNAIKFTQQGHVLLRCRDDGKAVVFEVEDTGIGIPAEQQVQIFEAFKQVDEQANRAFEGTGLGLAICREYVHLLGGDIELRSETGKGSCFSLYLPL